MLKSYEGRREALERELSAYTDVKAAADCLNRLLEKVRLDERALLDARARKQADRLFETARRAALLMAGAAQADVSVEEEKPEGRLNAVLMGISGGAAAVLTAWMLIIGENGAALTSLIGLVAIAVRQLAMQRKSAPRVKVRAVRVDAYELMRLMDRLMQLMEEMLEQIAHEQTLLPGDAPRVTGDVLVPVQMLMEAVYTGDGDYALKAAPQLAQALCGEGIRLVEYSQEMSSCFDLFPGTQPDMTIRPAVFQGERLLVRGQATQAL